MFCCLINRKFSNKCKHSVKRIKRRMEMIRKKQHAMLRYLKKDVADLISGGYDANAFGRMNALIVEINKSTCYDMIEQYCCCILEHLPTMQKDRVCPEATTEAIATLIFAAARFSDLPELVDLRRHFTARYDTHMDTYINKEFVEKLQKKSFSKDKKLQLMQYIAQEFSIHWDVKAFEFKISNPSAPTNDQPKTHISSNNENNQQQSHLLNGRREVSDGRNEVVNGGNPVLSKAENSGTAYQARHLQKQQLNSEELFNSEVVKENQNTIQMERYVHRTRSVVQKKVAHDELENVESNKLYNKVPIDVKTEGNQNGNYAKDWNCPGNVRKRLESVREGLGSISIESQTAVSKVSGDTKFTGDLRGNSTKCFAYSTVKEMDSYNVHESRPSTRVNTENNRPFNLKPPYVKPRNNKSPSETGYFVGSNYEMSDGGAAGDGAAHLKKMPFSVRRKHLEQTTAITISDPTAVHDNLKDAGSHNDRFGDVNDQQVFVSRLSKRTEDDAIYSRNHQKGRSRTREPSAQSILDSVMEQQHPKVSSHIHSDSMLRGQLSSYGERVPSRLPDHDDLADRLAALKKL